MKLHFKKEQYARTGRHQGMMFRLSSFLEMTAAEVELRNKYLRGELILVSADKMISAFIQNKELTLGELMRGIMYERNDVSALLEGKRYITEACENLARHLRAMESFEGEDVLDIRELPDSKASGAE